MTGSGFIEQAWFWERCSQEGARVAVKTDLLSKMEDSVKKVRGGLSDGHLADARGLASSAMPT